MMLVDGLRFLLGEPMTSDERQRAFRELKTARQVTIRMQEHLWDAEARMPPESTSLSPEDILTTVLLLAVALEMKSDQLQRDLEGFREALQTSRTHGERQAATIVALAEMCKSDGDPFPRESLWDTVRDETARTERAVRARIIDATNDERRRIQSILRTHLDLKSVPEEVTPLVVELFEQTNADTPSEGVWSKQLRDLYAALAANTSPSADRDAFTATFAAKVPGQDVLAVTTSVKVPGPISWVQQSFVPAEDPDHE